MYVPTVLMAKSSLPEQSVQGVCTQPTAAEVNQRQRADEYGQMALNSGTFCSWTRPRQSRNESQNCAKVTLQCLQYSRNAEVQRPKWSFFFFFYIIHPARLMSSPTASAQRSVAERATHGQSKGSDTANNKVHHYLTLHG